ncbi:enoyl-CoA hydratase/isomerase family protein [Solimonas soli]|uniref:enoyl-CoA hydratase/isomerase family protein n=1 Tax=Solimonas soli TaxID=413479 RepID=UPI0004AD2C9E|nr:enoyl-CoA hydratase-related protein [Solimonas soli]
MNTSAPIEIRQEERILIATLNRPEAANGINPAMATALEDLARRVEEGSDVDALIIIGNGRVFCSGGDVSAFKAALESSAEEGALAALLNDLASRVHAALERLVSAGPLLIAAVNGPATGAGLGLLCACDFAYAKPSAVLRAGFSRLKLSPDTGTTYFLPRIVGYRKALELLLRGAPLQSDIALQLGIFNEIIDADDASFLGEVVGRTKALIAAGPAVVQTRRLLQQSLQPSLGEQLDREQKALVGLAALPEIGSFIRAALARP